MTLIASFLKCRSGATAIEYGVVSSLLGLTLLTAGSLLGQVLQGQLDTIGGSLRPSDLRPGGCERSLDAFDLCP